METRDQRGESWKLKKNEDAKSKSYGILLESENTGQLRRNSKNDAISEVRGVKFRKNSFDL